MLTQRLDETLKFKKDYNDKDYNDMDCYGKC